MLIKARRRGPGILEAGAAAKGCDCELTLRSETLRRARDCGSHGAHWGLSRDSCRARTLSHTHTHNSVPDSMQYNMCGCKSEKGYPCT